MSTPADAASEGLRVLRGTPDDAELAALLAAAVALQASQPPPESSPTSAWMDRRRNMRGRRIVSPLGRGDNAWRHSFR